MSKHASYLDCCFNPKKQSKAIKRIKEQLKDIDFDAFIVTGMSGVIMGSVVARSMKKQLTVVRKSSDGTHSNYPVENFIDGKYVFLDDLVATGSTFNIVKQKLKEENTKNAAKSKIVASVIYEYPQLKKGSSMPKKWYDK